MTNDEMLQIMSAKLGAFEDGSMPLHWVVPQLEAVANTLYAPEPSWVEQVNEEILELEIVNALSLNEGHIVKYPHDDFVQEKVSRIRALIEHYPEVIR